MYKLIGFLVAIEGQHIPTYIPLDRTAHNAADLYGWQPVYAKAE